jgi:hypothetical protein
MFRRIEMRRARILRKLMALGAVLVLSIISFAGTVPNMRAGDPDLTNELRILGAYFDDLIALQNECAELEKRAVLQHIHINPVVRKSEDLKNRLSGVQQAVREVITKLKAANLWNDFDRQVQARLTDPLVHTGDLTRRILEGEGFKQLMEDAAAKLSSHKNEISIPVDNLLKRVASRTSIPNGDRTLAIALVAYHPLTPAAYRGLACEVGKVITLAKVMDHLGVVANSAILNRVSCACGQSTSCR